MIVTSSGSHQTKGEYEILNGEYDSYRELIILWKYFVIKVRPKPAAHFSFLC